jgi:tetraprenyl-beta-curcumene synthase
MSALGDRRLAMRAGMALVLANIRYWPSVAPLVRTQLSRWERSASAIGDPFLRTLALQKLREERFNVEVSATLATLAPRAHRAHAVEAIVAYAVLYDYLDVLTEQPTSDPLRDGRQLFCAFIDAVNLQVPPDGDYHRYRPQSAGTGYLEELVGTVRRAVTRLPAAGAIADVALISATRCAEAQVRAHAAPRIGREQLEQWARREVSDPMGWREFLMGSASSVLVIHALIAFAADERTTREQAVAVDATYLPLCLMSTILDSLIDHERDMQSGQSGYIQYYDGDYELICRNLTNAARDAADRARDLPHEAHHVMTLAGVAAYYTSAPPARGDGFARPISTHIQAELRPLITPTLALMRAWRITKQLRQRLRVT